LESAFLACFSASDQEGISLDACDDLRLEMLSYNICNAVCAAQPAETLTDSAILRLLTSAFLFRVAALKDYGFICL
jgi:hypothetical protein